MHNQLREFSRYGANLATHKGVVKMTLDGAHDLATRILKGDTFSAYVAYNYFSYIKPEEFTVPMNAYLARAVETVYGNFLPAGTLHGMVSLFETVVGATSSTPVVTDNAVELTVAYPASIDSAFDGWAHDAKVISSEPMPAGATLAISYNDRELVTGVNIGGLTEEYLSVLLGSGENTRTAFTGHANATIKWDFVITSTAPIKTGLIVKSVISKDGFKSEEVIHTVNMSMDYTPAL